MTKKSRDLSEGQYRRSNGICFEPLEPRLMLSADWGAGALAAAPDSQALDGMGTGQDSVALLNGSGLLDVDARQPDRQISSGVDLLAQAPALNLLASAESGTSAATDRSSALVAATPRELVFVDGGIENHGQLVSDLLESAGADRTFEIIVLDTDRDGVAQVSEALSGRQDLAAVHFVTHGNDGAVQLGATSLNSDNLAGYAADVSGWQNALAAEADLLFYGCDLAAGENGRALLSAVGQLANADVAASDDLTGDARMGGDWQLEYQSGDIETAAALNPLAQQKWSGVLATFNVDTTADTVDANPGDGLAQDVSGNTSLRAAIMEANALAGADTINLSAGTYSLSLPGAGEEFAASGDLDITSQITINGIDAASSIIDAGDIDRVFHLTNGSADLTLADVTVRNGSINDKGGGIFVDHNLSRLDAERVVVTGNMADDGAGIFNDGTMTLTDVVISNNGNAGTNEGGGLHNKENATLNRVTISGNQAIDGGGIHNDNAAGTILSMTNSTVSGNSASGNGGGLHSQNPVSILNSTFTLNTAFGNGGGIFNNESSVSLQNTIVAGNSGLANPDLDGNFNSLGHNLIQNTTGASGLVGSDITGQPALLDPLADNGGFGQTHALQAGSPAIDPAGLTGAPGIDQRGMARDGTADIGAYEFNGAVNDPGTVTIDNTSPAQGETLTASVGDADGATGAIAYQWYRDGVAIAGATGTAYTTVQDDVGAVITVRAIYTDDLGSAESPTSAGTAPVVNVNDPGTVTIDNTTPSQGETLTASVGDADGASGAVAYQWYRNGVAIAGATGAAYTTVQADVGAVITVEATYTDDLGASESIISAGTSQVAEVNDPPFIGVNSGTTVAEGSSGTVITSAMLKAGDTDDDAEDLIYTIISVSGYGTLRLNGAALGLGDTFTQEDIDNNRITYDHDGSESPADGFGFSVADGGEDGAAAATGFFRIAITPVNDNDPVAADDAMVLKQGGTAVALTGGATSVLSNDIDRDMPNDALTVVLDSDPAHGRLILNPDGTFSYSHDGSQNYTDSFTYTVFDADGGVTATGTVAITVIPPAINPPTDPPPADGDTADPEPDTEPEADEPPDETEETPAEDPPVVVAPPTKATPGERLGSQPRKSGGGRMALPQQGGWFRDLIQTSRSAVTEVAERLLNNDTDSGQIGEADTGRQLADHQARLANRMAASAYLHMTGALDDLKDEVDLDNQVYKAYLGPAIASTVGLSAGYVVWLLRGGMLLTSLLSSLPAWQILDPLPILGRKKDDGDTDDDETLESILERKPRETDKARQSADPSTKAGQER